jgi:RNA polymerase sigma-B factor
MSAINGRTRIQDPRSDAALQRHRRAGDDRAREVLIERYLPLARGLALRYRRTAEPADDLIQVAALGLVKAVDRWDATRGVAFSSFAVPTILGELRRYFRDATWSVRPPRSLQELSRAVDRARDDRLETGRAPTVDELAERLGRSREDVLAAAQAGDGRWTESLDAPRREEDGWSSLLDQLGSDDAEYERAEARATIERLTACIDHRGREILRLRYEDDLHQREIAARVGCTQMHVSRLIRSALKQLATVAAEPLAA